MPKTPLGVNVLEAAENRISWAFDKFPKLHVAFSGGKDSTVLLHLVMDEAIKRERRVGIVFIDLEGQYKDTIDHVAHCFEMYKDHSDQYWVCLPIHLRNAVSVYQPFWKCWDQEARKQWIRQPPHTAITAPDFFPFFSEGMEFEEFVPEFAEWFADGEPSCCFVGIRTDESLNRFRTIASVKKESVDGKLWTTRVTEHSANIYPIYDWRTEDVWTYHGRNPEKPYNNLYNLMHKAGLSIHQQRICQPYGDDQRRGLWLFHLIEPDTWARVVARVNGANGGALYINETGNITGYRSISKPPGHTWESFAQLLVKSMPPKLKEHYENKILLFVRWWKDRGYDKGIPDECPKEVESKRLAPSWRRVCKSLLRNDYWCKGLGFSQQKSGAYKAYLDLMRRRKEKWQESLF